MSSVYSELGHRPPFDDRPWVSINMVATIDGKTVSGSRDEPVADLGSTVDHQTMRYLESQSEGVLIGAGSLRATPGLHYDKGLVRFVATRSGDLDYGSRFFSDCPDKAWVLASSEVRTPEHVRRWPKTGPMAWTDTLLWMRRDLSIGQLMVEGGSELNADLIREDLVDELFLTIAPVVKLGRNIPTYAGGGPLSKNDLLRFNLVSTIPIGNEVFLRYQRCR
ncbi:MAG: dihydrofolate reductase family protein [Chthonomonadaceae bacterium]|nr:dihydrofolate reductase family protein [Chthonomonadaceae bacterium]